jgi:hypothetical protein
LFRDGLARRALLSFVISAMASRTICRAAVISAVVAFSAEVYGEREAVVVALWTRWSAWERCLEKEGKNCRTRHTQKRAEVRVSRIMLEELGDLLHLECLLENLRS